MRIRFIMYILSRLILLIGALMLIPGIVCAFYKEPQGVIAFALSSMLAISFGIAMKHMSIKGELDHKEVFAVTTFGWMLAVIFGALPFFFMGMNVEDAVFESMSGFTTTGATILTEYDSLGYWIIGSASVNQSVSHVLTMAIYANFPVHVGPSNVHLNGSEDVYLRSLIPYFTINHTFYGLLFWRAFTQILGGLGIILLFIAILPHLGVAGRQLYNVQSAAVSKDPLTPRVKNTAKLFWGIYLGLMIMETILLSAAGVPVYDSMCTSFATVATGGFSPLAAGIAAYNNVLVDFICIVFMFLGATSFILHYQALNSRSLSVYLKDDEFRFFAVLLTVSILIIVIWGGISGDIFERIRFASFDVVSIASTTGFANTSTYDSWSTGAKILLVIMMLIGGCAGSTAGAIKVSRIQIFIKCIHKELIQAMHPKAVYQIRLGGTLVKDDVLHSIISFILLYLTIFIALSLAISLTETGNSRFDTISAMSAVASCMGGVGPGFGVVAFDFSSVSPLGKMIGIISMFIGRLEILPIMLFFVPEFWRE